MPDQRQPSIILVTGSHLAAEVSDRPLAYHLRSLIVQELERTETEPLPPDDIVVCSDLWYLNNAALRERPTISVGGPTVNALTASWAESLPSVFAIDQVLIVQGDWSQDPPVAAIWGVHTAATARAIEAFREKYLADFLSAV